MVRRTNKKSVKPNKKVRLKVKRRLVGALFFALIAGSIGSYFLYASRAATVPDNTVVISADAKGDSNAYSSYKVNPESGKIHLYLKVPNYPGGTNMHFAIFMIVHLKAQNFQCSSGYTCEFKERQFPAPSLHESVYDYDANPTYGPVSELNFCVNLKPSDSGRSFVVGTLNFDPRTVVHRDYSVDWRQDFYSASTFATGVCKKPPGDKWYGDASVEQANGNTLYGGGLIKGDWGERGEEGGCTRNCGGDDGDDGDPGDGDGSGGDGRGNDGDGEGRGTGGGGGGSGGSSANKQSNKNNTLPNSSSRGKSKQPELFPSPFYDGKQYKPGSESDNFVIGAVSSTGRAVVNNWLLALAVLALAGAGGALYWKKYRK